MLEYFTYRKVKKHKAQKRAHEEAEEEAKRQAGSVRDDDDMLDQHANELDKRRGKQRADAHDGHRSGSSAARAPPVLQPDDEYFLEELLAADADDDETAPPLPPRHYLDEFGLPSDNEAEAPSKTVDTVDAVDKAEKKPSRLSLLFTRQKKNEHGLKPEGVPPEEGEREAKDLGRVLDRLNLLAKNNKVISTDSSEVLQRFTQVFKDLVNGVPTAYDDLAKLVEDRDGTLSRGFDKLPSSLKKLVTQLPDKITGSLAPEILAAAAGAQGIKADADGGIKGTVKKILTPHNLAELVTKPGAVVGMLRAIVEVLKTRWPAFIGMNVIWSVALSLLLFVLWYCHKRGREERLLREQSESAIDGSDRIEELPDDPALPAPEPRVVDASAESVSTSVVAPSSAAVEPLEATASRRS
ncbi:Uncharacterized protein TCAP_01473 [Tolypocladium capitatum]|uniref:Ring-like domain-containing protein n=1 Tax=Tolypocladium capitatum TaxID=45235 RepID=A0A2K3QM65_9HYPO|nr:Uncharacterized protein TCAP_01473 [Tolypocladium capitatum]